MWHFNHRDSYCSQKRELAQALPGLQCKIGFSTSWKMDFSWVWHITIFDDFETTTISLLRSICKQHGATQRNSLVIWTDKLYISLRRDLLQHHRESAMHKEAQQLEATNLVS